jgi:hypothetical protein
MAILKEITAVVGQYTNREGQTKNRYQRLGSIIDTKNGWMLKLDNIPLKEGGWDGWAYVNDPRPKEMKLDNRPLTGGQFQDMDDDLPF